MRNGIHFNKMTLVNASRDEEDDPAAYYPYQPESDNAVDKAIGSQSSQDNRAFFVFLAISITCAAATLVTGTYAVWLSRQQAARQALTDVNDILKSCQSRMRQLEADVQRLPNRQA